ncbi:MAG: hypothetical protein EAZ20_00625, partial [Bacteroidetes bacterium]
MKILSILLMIVMALAIIPAIGAAMMSPMIGAAAPKNPLAIIVFLLVLAFPIVIIACSFMAFSSMRQGNYTAAFKT